MRAICLSDKIFLNLRVVEYHIFVMKKYSSPQCKTAGLTQARPFLTGSINSNVSSEPYELIYDDANNWE
jgi:hypothetical protein